MCTPVPPDLINVHGHWPFRRSYTTVSVFHPRKHTSLTSLACLEKAWPLFFQMFLCCLSWLHHYLSLQVLLIFKDSVRPYLTTSTKPAAPVPQLAVHLILNQDGASSIWNLWRLSFFSLFLPVSFSSPNTPLPLFTPLPCSLPHCSFCLSFFPYSYLGQGFPA